MRALSVIKSKILIEENIISKCGKLILNSVNPCKTLIVSDRNVAKIYLNIVSRELERLGFQVQAFLINPGEQSKSFEVAEKIYNVLTLNFMSRCDLIISLGGGVVTDLSGFVASTYHRGMKLVHIPTSFLAMIDAAIGGKNGVNSNYGKNLIGTFYHPSLILIDPLALKTLPSRELCCGIAEAIKCGCIWDKELFKILENQNFYNNINEIIIRSIKVKKELAEIDEQDFGSRMLLNFGHTIGHALEKIGCYKKISHGEAVSIGMNEITRISESMNLTRFEVPQRLKTVCKKYFLPTNNNFSRSQLQKAVLHDKKILNGYLNLVLIKDIGKSFIYKISDKEFINFLKNEI